MATGTDPIPWISIHALREEGDNAYVLWQRSDIDFYPRPPRGGRRFSLSSKGTVNLFLSTPSARRATCTFAAEMPDLLISIHALREEGDWIFDGLKCTLKRFLSTPSARRATWI